jgi:hypothetical protein
MINHSIHFIGILCLTYALFIGIISKEAGIEYKYFRHSYLDAGTSEAKRKNLENYLKHKGYIIAPVTIDTDDWEFDQELREHPNEKLKIIAKYFEHTKLKCNCTLPLSNKFT